MPMTINFHRFAVLCKHLNLFRNSFKTLVPLQCRGGRGQMPLVALMKMMLSATVSNPAAHWGEQPLHLPLSLQKTYFFLSQTSLVGGQSPFLALPKMYWHICLRVRTDRTCRHVALLYALPPRTCCLLYSISCLLDALDGAAARRLEQSTQFGAVLDMVTDRCTTSCLLVFLASAFPRWSIVFQGLISLDLASHYIHMYATLVMGGSSQSHKKMDQSRPWVMRIYYSNTVSEVVRFCPPEAYLIAASSFYCMSS